MLSCTANFVLEPCGSMVGAVCCTPVNTNGCCQACFIQPCCNQHTRICPCRLHLNMQHCSADVQHDTIAGLLGTLQVMIQACGCVTVHRSSRQPTSTRRTAASLRSAAARGASGWRTCGRRRCVTRTPRRSRPPSPRHVTLLPPLAMCDNVPQLHALASGHPRHLKRLENAHVQPDMQ